MGSFAPAGLGDGGLGKRRSVQGILQIFSFHYLCDLAFVIPCEVRFAPGEEPVSIPGEPRVPHGEAIHLSKVVRRKAS